MLVLTKGLPSLRFKLICFLIAITLVLIYTRNRNIGQTPYYDELPIDAAVSLGQGLSPEEQYFARLSHEFQLTNETEWLAWRIRHSRKAEDWSAVNDVRVSFGSRGRKVVFTEQPDPSDLKVKNRMDLTIPRDLVSERPSPSEFVFGITTTYARIMDRDSALLKSWTRWLTKGNKKNNGASLVIMLDQAKSAQVKEVEQLLQASGVNAQVTATAEPMSTTRRYHELVGVMKSLGAVIASSGGEMKQWFALVEDDVFFPDMAYLQRRLAPYKPIGQLYIGIPSERDDWEMMEDGSTMTTYGGGAVFLSRPALGMLSQLSCFDLPKSPERFHAQRWDILLQECLTRNTGLNMFILPGFYNPDDENFNPNIDAYETGVRPLLLHRPLERHGIDVNMAHLVTNVCGNACFMQRYLFNNNWVLVNGISITQHTDELKYVHGHEGSSQEDEEHERPSVASQIVIDDAGIDRTALTWTENKQVWQFVDSVMSDNGTVWQAYIKKANGEPGPDNIDSVIVLIWENTGSKLRLDPKKQPL